MELFRIKNDIPFMSYGRLTTTISLVTFILAVFFLATRGLNFGVDFTGGTIMEVSYPQAANLESIRKAVDNIGLKEEMCIRDRPYRAVATTSQTEVDERGTVCTLSGIHHDA